MGVQLGPEDCVDPDTDGQLRLRLGEATATERRRARGSRDLPVCVVVGETGKH